MCDVLGLLNMSDNMNKDSLLCCLNSLWPPGGIRDSSRPVCGFMASASWTQISDGWDPSSQVIVRYLSTEEFQADSGPVSLHMVKPQPPCSCFREWTHTDAALTAVADSKLHVHHQQVVFWSCARSHTHSQGLLYLGLLFLLEKTTTCSSAQNWLYWVEYLQGAAEKSVI